MRTHEAEVVKVQGKVASRVLLSRAVAYETMRARGVQLAREVSAVLAAAGLERSKPGSCYRHATRGFRATEHGNGTYPEPTATVWWSSGRGTEEPGQLELVRAALEASGRFSLETFGRNGLKVLRARGAS